MKYWLLGNKTMAESMVLHQAIGYLTERRKSKKQIDIDEILRYIEKAVAEETEDLNKRHPEYAQD